MKKRTGAPTTGTQVADGTDGSLTAPRIILFERPVSPCIVCWHGELDELLVKINVELDGTVTNDFDNDSDDDGAGHVILPPRVTLVDASKDPPEGSANWVDLSMGGQLAIHSVSFCTVNGSDDLDDVSVVGWDT